MYSTGGLTLHFLLSCQGQIENGSLVWGVFFSNFSDFLVHPPASEVSREVANLTERKNQHTPIYGVKEFVCLPVCLSIGQINGIL